MQRTHPVEAVRQAEDVLVSDVFTTPWQHAWLCRVLTKGVAHVNERTLAALVGTAGNEGAHWLTRVEAMKVLGAAGRLEQELVVRSWKLAPRPYRCDLIAAAAAMPTAGWAKRFLEAARQDPVEAVVVNHVIHDG
jgi:hypothetical protein